MIKAAAILSTFALAISLTARADDAVERGRYLVEEVGKCQDCHTPMGPDGPDKTKWLKGATLGFQPIHPPPKWEKSSPDITPSGKRWKTWGEKGIVTFLETGVGPGGHTADPPMPTYKLKHEDAEAIVAYLKTFQ